MKLASVLALLFSISVFAQVPPTNRPGYCPLVEDIFCEDFVISKLSRWDYDEEHEYNLIRNACSGNYGSKCLESITKPLSRHHYDDLDEMTTLAKSCQLTNSKCVDYIATKISVFDFNSVEDVAKVAKACARADVSCIQRRCNTREYRCNRTEDILRAAKRCYKKCYYPN